MELSKFKVEESTELSVLQTIDIDENIFLDIMDKVISCMTRLGIKLDDKSVYYQRYANKTSILAIKLGKGEENDTNNFMFNGCDATYFNGDRSCDVYLHANKKIGQEAMNMANMMSSDIVEFFNTIEGELVLNGLSDSELFIRIPLSNGKDKKNDKKGNRLLKVVKNMFRK